MSMSKQPPGAGGVPHPPGTGANPTVAAHARLGFEERLLTELQVVVAERAATAGREDAPDVRGTGPVSRRAKARRPVLRTRPRRLAVTGALSAALAAGVAVTLTVTTTGSAPAPGARYQTTAAFFNRAALAALREPTVTPSPGQYIYHKGYGTFSDAARSVRPAERGTSLRENWESVSGTRPALNLETIRYNGGPARHAKDQGAWCSHGYLQPPERVNGKPVKEHCTPQEFSMLLPQLPATTAGARAYLSWQRELPETSPAKLFDGHGTGDVLAGAFYILTWYYLTPGQQAAMYHALAAIPGLTVVPHVTDLLGRPGVGIRYHSAAKRTTWTAIFDPTTFRPLGADVAAPGRHNRSAVVPATLVSKLGQRP